jgi:hypothetical protein
VTTLLLLVLVAQTTACGGCHEAESRLEPLGAHAKAATCVDCHGGKLDATDKATGHGSGFTGKISRLKVPTLCATCHSDVRRMNPFGLPTDQLSQYLTSRHGEAITRGETDAAVCIDCHGVHGIRRPRDPSSPVSPANVPATCGRCHADSALMTKHQLPSTAESLYRDSVHGRLLAKGDTAAPNCATCHGNHGSTPPGFEQVAQVCGKCHVAPREKFEESPHAFYAKDGSFKGCVVCHDHHRIIPRAEDMRGRCAPCHEEGDPEIRKAGELWAILAEGRREYHRAKDRVESLTRAGHHTEDELILLEGAHTALLQLSPMQHSLNTASLREASSELGSAARAIHESLDRKAAGLRTRTYALVAVWSLLGILAWLLWIKRKAVMGHESGTTP